MLFSAELTPSLEADDVELTSPYGNLVHEQKIYHVEEFPLESGITLHHAPVAYKTWGTLNDAGTNVMIICHALTGSADVVDWWGPLLGKGKAFDPSVFFIVCANTLGSPYGTASPCTTNPATAKPYGPEFPAVSIRDTVRLHRLVLDQLGVREVQVVVGGSMGGMQVLEWAYFGADYVKAIIPIATSGRHSAWCISWGEAQRQAIYSDPHFNHGHYTEAEPPNAGLSAARMQALLTYRSRTSFESRFGRKQMTPKAATRKTATTTGNQGEAKENNGESQGKQKDGEPASTRGDTSPNLHFDQHNEGNRRRNASPTESSPLPVYSAQSYLRYQGDKFVRRFDANCYLSLTRMLDTHDVSRGRGAYPGAALGAIRQQHTLIIGVESDGLFTLDEQQELHEHIPNSELVIISSAEGHDGFLIEFERMNEILVEWLLRTLPADLRASLGKSIIGNATNTTAAAAAGPSNVEPVKTSLFGEAEGEELLNW